MQNMQCTTDMSPDTITESSESDVTSMNFKDTELTLGLPGGESRSPAVIGGTKRGFTQTVDLKLGSSSADQKRGKSYVNDMAESHGDEKSPSAVAQVVGWPPVRSFRKKALENCKYVKVAVDGAPYLRKVDLLMYTSYQELLRSLEEMFTCFTIRRNYMDESKLMGPIKGTEYVPTYEDKDGDWMLVGDVPWKMFIESCKRIRLMKSSEAVGLAPRTPPKCSSTG